MSCSHHKRMLSFTGSTGTVINDNGLTILKATYGIQNNFTDVTEQVKNLVQDGDLNFTVSAQDLGILDPAPGVTKTFQMQYTVNKGKPQLLSKNDTEQVGISVPKVASKDKKDQPTIWGSIFYGIGAFIIMFIAKSAYDYNVVYVKDASGTVTTQNTFALVMFFLVFLTYGHSFWLSAIYLFIVGLIWGN